MPAPGRPDPIPPPFFFLPVFPTRLCPSVLQFLFVAHLLKRPFFLHTTASTQVDAIMLPPAHSEPFPLLLFRASPAAGLYVALSSGGDCVSLLSGIWCGFCERGVRVAAPFVPPVMDTKFPGSVSLLSSRHGSPIWTRMRPSLFSLPQGQVPRVSPNRSVLLPQRVSFPVAALTRFKVGDDFPVFFLVLVPGQSPED